ncbi:MAG: hypothetical protein QOH67_678 [Hyphomicrobiales bacterium]|jgi:hypothetical protein|nr:hypothetical protein [Hyphomicrobiales bacterium]
MLRHFVAFAVLALTGMLALPDPSFAAPGGFRGGGGFRAAPVMIPRHARPGMARHPRAIVRPDAAHFGAPLAPRFAPGLARTSVRQPFGRLERRHHHRYVWPYVYPSTTDDNGYGYFGTPYDPAEGIPVYAPPSITDLDAPPLPALPPRLSGTREEDGEACRSEHVTVPAAEGEREITLVRC